jgi:hypothetical protein
LAVKNAKFFRERAVCEYWYRDCSRVLFVKRNAAIALECGYQRWEANDGVFKGGCSRRLWRALFATGDL